MGSDQRNSDAGSREKEEEVSGFRWFVSVAMFALSKQGVARGGPKGLGHALQMTSTSSTSAASSAGCGSSYSQRRRRTFSRRANSLAARVQSRPRVEATEPSVVSTSLNTEETNHTTANTSTRTNSKVVEKNGVGKVKTLRKPRRTQKTSKMSKEARAKRKGKDVKTRKLEEIAQKRRYRFMAVSSTFLMFGLASSSQTIPREGFPSSTFTVRCSALRALSLVWSSTRDTPTEFFGTTGSLVGFCTSLTTCLERVRSRPTIFMPWQTRYLPLAFVSTASFTRGLVLQCAGGQA